MAREVRPIVRIEELDPKLRRLAEAMAESGREAGEEARALAHAQGREWRSIETPQDIDALIDAARSALEEDIAVAETVAAPVQEGEEFIRPSERDIEVAKRALARLRLPQLRRLADDVGLDSSGNEENIVDRIAREYDGDEEQIARLIIKFEEARPERGLVDRLFAVHDEIRDLQASAASFEGLEGRYIRIGIAKWLVFERARFDDAGLWLEGLYRSYSAEAKREGENFALVSVPADAPVTARIRPDQQFIEVRGRGEAESRAMIRALEWGTSLRHADALPLNIEASEGPLMAWDARTIFMLNFLDRRLPDGGLDIINLTSARFETAAAERRFTRRPTVRSVALQGQHVIDSKAACELLVEGRALIDVSLDVLFRPQPNYEFLLPIRVSFASDHISVLTGFGVHSPDDAAALHRELVQRVRASLSSGVKVDDRLNSLANRIGRRARSEEPVREADIFAPPPDYRAPDEQNEEDESE